MTLTGIRMLLILLSLLALAAAGLGIVLPIPATTPPPHPPSAVRITMPPPNVDSLVHAAVTPASFRAGRVLASVMYDPNSINPNVVREATLTVAKPRLSLSGIVWGGEPVAVLEGLPGTTGPRIVRSGETIGELKVKRIDASGVAVVGLDTTWNLTVRMPWQ